MAKTAKFKIKRINVLQASIVASIVAFFFSIIFVLIYGLFLYSIMSSIPVKDQAITTAIPFIGTAFFLAPILYGIIAFISTAIFTFLFNLVAKWLGGIEIDVEILGEVQED
ncbi:MAG: hypothetical protein GXO48_01830 [Chlorobi bacterium]|nr:hypothetical protein [Chlorobiota bacterium]